MSGSKQFAPSAKKKQRAREKGNIARSRDVTSAVLFGCGVLVVALSPLVIADVIVALRAVWRQSALSYTADSAALSASVLAPIAILSVVLVFCALVAASVECFQVGLRCNFSLLKLDFNRLNPATGFLRIFGLDSNSSNSETFPALRLFIDIIKYSGIICGGIAVAVCGSIWVVLHTHRGMSDISSGAAGAYVSLLHVAEVLVGISLLVAIVDYVWQRHRHTQSIRMDSEEMKREYRESEGSSEVKQMRKQLHQDISRQAVPNGVRSARVVVAGRGSASD